jgi:hypothetical protein
MGGVVEEATREGEVLSSNPTDREETAFSSHCIYPNFPGTTYVTGTHDSCSCESQLALAIIGSLII